MAKYIDADKLKKALRELKSDSCMDEEIDGFNEGIASAIEIIDSLQQERPEDRVEGVPLTPKILEKNGIELSVGPGGLYQGAISGVNCHIEFNIIKYAHELQHALRLCGIEKEIEL